MQLTEDLIIENLREETRRTWKLNFLNPAAAGTLLALLVIGLTTFGLRFFYLDRSFDIFIDEITYNRIIQNVATNLQLTLYGQPFFLHPPGFFYFAAGFLHLVNPPNDTLQQIYTLRLLNVLFATFTSLAVFLIVRHLANWKLGLAAAGMFAIEQYIIKMNSMVMLETSAIWWVVAGYGFLLTGNYRKITTYPGLAFPNNLDSKGRFNKLPGFTAKPAQFLYNRLGLGQPLPVLSLKRTVPAGIFFGLALLTKDMTAFLTLVPLGLCFVLNWSLNRRDCFRVGLITVVTYLVHPVSVLLTGSWDAYASVKLHGLFRLTGVVKETGITQGNRASFIEMLLQNIDKSGTTYLLILTGALAAFFLLLFGNKVSRLFVSWTGSSYVLMGFCVLTGSLEEQFFYFLIISSIISVVLGVNLLISKRDNFGKFYPALMAVVILAGFFYFGDNLYQWGEAHLKPNNGYAQVLNYLHQNLPEGTRVAATSETAQFLFDDYKSGPFGKWSDPQDLKKNNAQYILISVKQLNWDQGANGARLLDWVNQHGVQVYRFDGEGDGPLLLYRL